MALARIGGSFLPIPSEAQVALDTLRGASVGVYRAEPHGRGRELLEAADRSLTARGWERTVGVIDGEQVVGVYVPRDLTSPRKMRVAVLVQSSDQLVLVTARANLNPLLDWIRKQTGGKSRLFPDAPFAFR
jgi:hypothetical protein